MRKDNEVSDQECLSSFLSEEDMEESIKLYKEFSKEQYSEKVLAMREAVGHLKGSFKTFIYRLNRISVDSWEEEDYRNKQKILHDILERLIDSSIMIADQIDRMSNMIKNEVRDKVKQECFRLFDSYKQMGGEQEFSDIFDMRQLYDKYSYSEIAIEIKQAMEKLERFISKANNMSLEGWEEEDYRNMRNLLHSARGILIYSSTRIIDPINRMSNMIKNEEKL